MRLNVDFSALHAAAARMYIRDYPASNALIRDIQRELSVGITNANAGVLDALDDEERNASYRHLEHLEMILRMSMDSDVYSLRTKRPLYDY